VDAVYADWGTPRQRPLRRLSIDQAVTMDEQKAFGEGSMAPKIRAAVDFVRRTGGRAIITSLELGKSAVRGEAGTSITATVETA
jgi:carbamate kinase